MDCPTSKEICDKVIRINAEHEIRIQQKRELKEKRQKEETEKCDKNTANVRLKVEHGIKIATLNVQGLNSLSKREEIMRFMEKHDIDIIALQENKINSNSKEEKNGFYWYFSSDVSDKMREKVVNKRETGERPSKIEWEQSTERLGTGFVMKEWLSTPLIWTRIITKQLNI